MFFHVMAHFRLLHDTDVLATILIAILNKTQNNLVVRIHMQFYNMM